MRYVPKGTSHFWNFYYVVSLAPQLLCRNKYMGLATALPCCFLTRVNCDVVARGPHLHCNASGAQVRLRNKLVSRQQGQHGTITTMVLLARESFPQNAANFSPFLGVVMVTVSFTLYVAWAPLQPLNGSAGWRILLCKGQASGLRTQRCKTVNHLKRLVGF